MSSDLLRDFEDIETLFALVDNEEEPMRNRRSYNRRLKCPLQEYDDVSFKKRYRLSKATITNVVLPEIVGGLRKICNRGLPISPMLQLLIALRFYATGCFQTVCGDLGGISQSTVCGIVARVSRQLAMIMDRHIHFPNDITSKTRLIEGFEKLGRRGVHRGLSGIIGAIDCTHIKIVRPRGIDHSEQYRNRKGFFSLNVQVICGPNMEIMDIVARWAGSTHDSRIFRNSRFHHKLENNVITGILVGDSGYASARYMLTPLLNPHTPAENNYNYAQTHTRNVIERVFGVWKRRFPCLEKGLGNKLTTTCNIIIACAVLHNIAIMSRDDTESLDAEASGIVDIQYPAPPAAVEGLAFRSAIIHRDFT